MSSDSPNVSLTFGIMEKISERAISKPEPHYVVCGLVSWMTARTLCEARLTEPLVGDVLIISGARWILSTNVDRDKIQVVPAAMVEKEIPSIIHRPAQANPSQDPTDAAPSPHIDV